MKYNKLVRDKIPEIIIAAGEKPKTRKLSDGEFKIELKKKVLEEAKELVGAKTKDEVLNEAVDIQELIDWIKKTYHFTDVFVKKSQKDKNQKRGSFKKRLFLVETEDK